MPHDLGFDDRVIGFGAGIFALGYVILEIPGTLIVERWSARRWFTRISPAACTESDVREQVELLLLNHERAGSFLGKLVNPKFHSPLDLELS